MKKIKKTEKPETKKIEKKETKKEENQLVVKKTKEVVGKAKKFIDEKKVFNVKLKKILSIIVCILLLLVVFKFVGGLLSKLFAGKYPEYPMVYQKANGDMMIIGTKDKNPTKLSSSDSIDYVQYANTTNRYVLYVKNESLYLYDANKKSEKIKVLKDAKEYYFSKDDKLIIATNKQHDLYMYDYKKLTKLDSEVTSVRAISEDYILYIRNGSLYLRRLKEKADKIKLEDKFGSYAMITENQKKVLYINKDAELKVYNIKKKESEKIASSVTEYYCDENCNKFYYLTNDDGQTLYYYNGKEGLKIVKGLYSVSAIDVDKKIAVYTKNDKNNFTLYYQKADKAAVKVEDDLKTTVNVEIFKGKELYYINSDKELRFAKIRGSKVAPARTVADNVTTSLKGYKKGYVFLADIDGASGDLYIAKGGRAKKISSDVYKSYITVNTKGNKIFFFTDYGSSSGELYYSTGGKPKLISSDVYKYQTIRNNLLYYIKDYNLTERSGDLYRYTGKSKLVEKEVRAISANPNHFELK